MIHELFRQDTNIKHLSITEPEKRKETFFNYEQELTQADWNTMTERLESNAQEGITSEIASSFAFSVKLLSPERFVHVSVGKALQEEQLVQVILNLAVNEKDEDSFLFPTILHFARQCRMFGHDEITSAINLSAVWNVATEQIAEYREKQDTKMMVETLATLKFIDPEKFEIIGFDENEKQQVIDYYLAQKAKAQYENNWYNYFHDAFHMRLLLPEKNDALIPPQEAWEEQIQILPKFRERGFIETLANTAAMLRLMAADEVIVSKDGLQIIDNQPKPFSHEALELPEMRRF